MEEVHTRGSINLCGGLLKELIMLFTGVKADMASVLLLTDDLADVGITSTEKIVGAMKNLLDHQVSGGTRCEL